MRCCRHLVLIQLATNNDQRQFATSRIMRHRTAVVCTRAHGRSHPMTSTTPFEPALVKIEPACRYLDVGRSKLYELIREGKLDAVKIGKSARVTTASLKQFVESLPASAGGSPIKRADTPSLEDLGLK